MDYIVCIPSYKRSKICNDLTLKCLNDAKIKKSKINVFVIEEEYDEYLNTLNPEWYNKLIIGKKGIVPQREFIENYYSKGDKIIMIDDDIKEVDLTLTEYKSLDDFFKDAFVECEKEGSFIWSVYPVFNSYFRESRKPITTELTYICGALIGVINRPNEENLKIQVSRDTGNKEDVERSILYWLKDCKTMRFNKVGYKTKYYGTDGGGLGTFKQRLEEMKTKTILLNEKYPDITRIKIRKNGLYEIVLKSVANNKTKAKIITQVNQEDDGVLELPKIDPIREDVLEVYNLLESITIPCVDNGRGRSGTFGRHRAMTMGMIRARASKEYGLSHNSKKHPALYEALMKLGKTIVPFEFNAIHVNHNVVCPRHLDPYNSGKSLLVSFGDYEGCNLMVEGHGEYNTNCSPIVFNGAKLYHYNTPLISGNKYSLVFFTNSH